MATWITHLMIADGVLAHLPALHRCGFCVGNIAPDCNVENENWTAFTPAREVTHWMQGKRKTVADAGDFRPGGRVSAHPPGHRVSDGDPPAESVSRLH